MNNKKFDVITVGDCKADHFIRLENFEVLPAKSGAEAKLVLPFAKKIPVASFEFFPGGNSLNAGVTFSRLGLRTAVLTSLGKDAEGADILKKMRSENISTLYAKTEKNCATDKSIILVAGGERTILSYHTTKCYKIPAKFPCDWVYLTSLGDEFSPVYHSILLGRKRDNYRLAYNPGTRQLLHSPKHVKMMLQLTDALFVNLQEAQMITGSKTGDCKKLLSLLSALGAKISVITDGPKGAFAVYGRDYYKIGAYPAKRVDSTGAGDAFASAFTAAIVRGSPVAEALRWGSVNSAGEISKVGVHNGLYRLDALVSVLKKSKNFKARKF